MNDSNFQLLLNEYKRPWKLSALFIGISLLILGSFYYQTPDWDISISLIMATFSYLTASWSMRVILERRWGKLPLMMFYTWFTIDGCYWIYWKYQNPVALEQMREANFFASMSLYFMCGLVWYYQGTLKEFAADAKRFIRTGSDQ